MHKSSSNVFLNADTFSGSNFGWKWAFPWSFSNFEFGWNFIVTVITNLTFTTVCSLFVTFVSETISSTTFCMTLTQRLRPIEADKNVKSQIIISRNLQFRKMKKKNHTWVNITMKAIVILSDVGRLDHLEWLFSSAFLVQGLHLKWYICKL